MCIRVTALSKDDGILELYSLSTRFYQGTRNRSALLFADMSTNLPHHSRVLGEDQASLAGHPWAGESTTWLQANL